MFPNYHLLPNRWVLCLLVLILCTFLHVLVFHCGCYGHVGVPHCVVVLPMEEQWAYEKCHPLWWFSTITFLNFLLYYWPTHFKACNDMNYFFQQLSISYILFFHNPFCHILKGCFHLVLYEWGHVLKNNYVFCTLIISCSCFMNRSIIWQVGVRICTWMP